MTRERELLDNLAAVRDRLLSSARASGRRAEEITLLAVGKTMPWQDVATLLQAGHRDFGENYVQEALAKIDAIQNWRNDAPTAPVPRWHFVGSLQSNKAKFLPGKFALFHGLHSASLAEKLDKACAAVSATLDCLIEVNVDEERSKGGVPPVDVGPLLEVCARLQRLRVTGLMCIPAAEQKNPRRPFAQLRELRDSLNRRGAYPSPLTNLSMGMTADFEAAIEEGSTIVRVGTAIFGRRK